MTEGGIDGGSDAGACAGLCGVAAGIPSRRQQLLQGKLGMLLSVQGIGCGRLDSHLSAGLANSLLVLLFVMAVFVSMLGLK